MKFSKRIPYNFIAAASLTLILSACGSSDLSSTGTLSISVTDAPVDTAEEVVVEFNGVEIKPANGSSITFDFTDRCEADPVSCQIDLLALTDGVSQQILNGETVPAGRYNWIRLMVNAEPGHAYIVIDSETAPFDLTIPSGAETGLKLNRGFTVPAGGEASFTIDFDLRKSVHKTGMGEYILRPTLRIVDNAETGTLSGTVDPDFFAGGGCTGAVYVFFADTPDAPDDVDDGPGPDPITSALVADDFSYKVGFLTEGDYLIAFTCDAAADDPAVDDDSATVSFLSTATVSITANKDTVYSF